MSTQRLEGLCRRRRAYRPGHADYAYDAKYGFRDWRGGGRSSARETAARVAAGAVARLVIPEVAIRAYVVELGGDRSTAPLRRRRDRRNPSSAPTPTPRSAGRRWSTRRARRARSLGAVVECVATGVPAGWGAPVYAKLDAELAAAMMSINAVKGVEIGDGFAAARLRGEENADAMRPGDGRRVPRQPCRRHRRRHRDRPAVVVRVAFKPTSSILTPVATIDREGEATEIAPRAATTPASASAARRWSRRWWRWCSPTRNCSTARNAAERRA